MLTAHQATLLLARADGICHLTTVQVTACLRTVARIVERSIGREIDVRGQIGTPGEVLIL